MSISRRGCPLPFGRGRTEASDAELVQDMSGERNVPKRSARRLLSPVLVVAIRIPAIRRLLAIMRWPRPSDVRDMSKREFLTYVRAIGLEAESKAALAESGGDAQLPAVEDLQPEESPGHRRAGTAAP